MDDPKVIIDEVTKNMTKLKTEYPKQMNGFLSFLKNVGEKGALDTKTKELIAIALSIATNCKWCIVYHTKRALDEGATKDEIMEASFVAATMGGGPSVMYTQIVTDTLEEFLK